MRFVPFALLLVGAAAAAADRTEQLIGIEQQLTAALTRSDADAVAALWADDLVWIGLNGKSSSKAEQLAGMRAPASAAPSVVAVTNKDVKVRLYDRSAVVTVLSTWTTKTPAGERATDYVATHVWREQRGEWLLVAAHVSRVAQPAEATPEARCELPAPSVLQRDGDAMLQAWELPATQLWFENTLPVAAGYDAYRAAIRAAGGDQARPVADPPQPKDEAERELWRLEDLNSELMYTGGGRVRAVQCLEAALFALQDARASQLTTPNEFIAHVLRKGERLKVYFGGSDEAFPPKSVYGLDEVAADVAAGWTYWAILHNHTVRTRDGKPALGVPAPSTSDVELFRGLAARLGLREIWVTNGMYTGVVLSEHLAAFHTRE